MEAISSPLSSMRQPQKNSMMAFCLMATWPRPARAGVAFCQIGKRSSILSVFGRVWVNVEAEVGARLLAETTTATAVRRVTTAARLPPQKCQPLLTLVRSEFKSEFVEIREEDCQDWRSINKSSPHHQFLKAINCLEIGTDYSKNRIFISTLFALHNFRGDQG